MKDDELDLEVAVGKGGEPARNMGSGPIDADDERDEIESRLAAAEALRARAAHFEALADEVEGREGAADYWNRAEDDDREREARVAAGGGRGSDSQGRRQRAQRRG